MGFKEGEIERSLWLDDLRKKGKLVERINRYMFKINDKVTIVKYSKKSGKNSFFFDITPRDLSVVDNFIFICGRAANYYTIPNSAMKNLEAITTHDSRDNRPKFRIDNTMHVYRPGGGALPRDLASYYQNDSLL